MFKECIQAQINLQYLGCRNHLEKLAEMFLNTFHREHILLKLKIKKLLRKIKSKNITAGVLLLFFFCCCFFVIIKLYEIAKTLIVNMWLTLFATFS